MWSGSINFQPDQLNSDKKAYKEDNQLRLVSLNDKYDDLIFNEVNDIEVIGTVVM